MDYISFSFPYSSKPGVILIVNVKYGWKLQHSSWRLLTLLIPLQLVAQQLMSTEPKRLARYLIPEKEESCSTYNMLQISSNLFRWTKEVVYADHYERALTVGILSIQGGTEPGVMLYMLPLAPGNSKAISHHGWGTPFDSFRCCYGTGVESFSKLGDSIDFEEEGEVPGLYIIQYISSSFTWKSGQILINQKVDHVVSWDPHLRVTITFPLDMGEGQLSALNLRIPTRTHLEGAEAAINDESLQIPAPGTFLSITQRWTRDDKLTLRLPISLRLEKIRPKYASIQAILYGPYLLVGHTTGDWNIKNVSADSLSEWITPIPAAYNDHLVTFSQRTRHSDSTSFLINSNHIITMGNHSRSGNNSALHSTFRLILADKSSSKLSTSMDAIGKSVMLEPFDHPGMLVVYRETDKNHNLQVAKHGHSVFRLVAGLDLRKGTVSLEAERHKGCFLYGGVNKHTGERLKLKCNLDKTNHTVIQAASFEMKKGMSKYHPMSFVANGQREISSGVITELQK
ncbi:unnamed protein product [Dovyalis caffra]|uniref:Uncharacterized protein n=1 Tax=Dovyalis caffra TaxID=77055 RepID=A0AAV1RU74_9ROSI|nr:unnamed protein product [Dovyalis caffra]